MRSLVPLLLLLSVSIPLRAAIVAGSEQRVEPVAYVPGGGSLPVIASAGPDSLVVWADALGIKAAVIAAPGAVSPIPSRRIHRGDGSRSVSIVWTGRAYLLTWVDGNNTMMAGTVSRDGVPIGERAVMSGGGTWSGALAWNGRHALLAGASAQTQQSLGLLLDGDGNVVKRDIAIADLPDTSNVRVVAVNDVFDVFWEKTVAATSASITPPPLQFTTSVRVARVSDEGVSLDAAGTIVTVTEQVTGNVGVAFDGHTLALSLMTVALPGQLQTLHRYLVDARTFATTALPDIKANGTTSNMLWSGSAFVVYWSDYNGFGYRFETVSFTADESVPMNAVVDGIGSSNDVVAASTGSSIVMTWTDHARGGSDVVAMTLAPDGKSRTSEKFFVAYGAQAETLPAIAPGLVVWGKTLPSGLAELFASRIAADGSTIGAPMQLSTTGRVSLQEPPLVVFTGSIWFVAWGEASSGSNDSLAGTDTRRISLDGTLIDAKPVETPNTASPSIAFNGSTILLPARARNGDLVAARFDANGTPTGNVTIAKGVYALSTSTASNGRDFLVTWTVGSDYWQYPSKDLIDIEGARVDAGGNVLDTTPIAIATGPADQIEPRVASNGTDYLVAFLTPALVSNRDMWQSMLQRVSRDGFDDGAANAFGDSSSSVEAITGNASGYWILTKSETLEPSLEAAHLDASGAMTDHATIAADVDPMQALAVTLLGNAALTAYARFDSAAEATRVFTRHLTTGLLHGRAAGR